MNGSALMRDHIYASNAQVRGTGLLQRNIMDCQPGFLIGSLNPLVAAYFAVAEPHAGNSAVYAYDIGRPLRLDENPDPFTLVSIARFTPPHISERITAQSGLFTVHPSPTEAFDSEKVDKYVIASSFRKQFKFILYRYGVTKQSLFPGLDGLVQSLSGCAK